MIDVNGRKSPKVLLVAEHASAVFGGEALIPLQYFRTMREMGVDVHLLVHQRTEKELRELFPNDLGRLHFVADSRVNVWCHKIGQLLPQRLSVFTVGAVSHLDTQVRQRGLAKALVRRHGFDVIHEPIPVSPKLPSVMYGLSAPVVIGPMNGGMGYPKNYNLAGPIERLLVFALRLTAPFWNWILPGKHQAAALLVANARTREALPGHLKSRRVIQLPENGVDLDLFKPAKADSSDKTFRIICVGRLIDCKRFDLLLDACTRLDGEVLFQVDLVGDGPMREALERQVRRVGLGNQVRFHGRLAQRAVADLLTCAHVMVLPSMHECGGAVVLEAMASAVPVVAADWGGPADYVAPDTGFLIPPATPRSFVEELGKVLLDMARNPQARAEMGQAGRRRAAALYDWRVKTKAILKIYGELLSSQNAQMNVGVK
jgi:glycosyltransferase involved in cell wall biosynthesis